MRDGHAVLAIVSLLRRQPSARSTKSTPASWRCHACSKLAERLRNDNVQGEYYLTDIVKFAVNDGVGVVATRTSDKVQVDGVNSPVQLAELERAYQRRLADHFMEQGVRLADPSRFDVRGTLICGEDVSIDVNCVFEGKVSLGNDVRIGANCVIANASIQAGAVIHPFTHIDGEALGVTVGEGALIGPFARLRPGAVLGAEVHIGNFVGLKFDAGQGCQGQPLAYLGDATVGERVNYSAGITANYDSANKHRTVIEAVHVGAVCWCTGHHRRRRPWGRVDQQKIRQPVH